MSSNQMIQEYLAEVEAEKFEYVEDPAYIDWKNKRDLWLEFIGEKELNWEW